MENPADRGPQPDSPTDPQVRFAKVVVATGRSGRFRAGKKKRSIKEWTVRLTVMFVSLFVAQFGVTFFLLSALGADPYTVYAQGLSRMSGVTVGMCHMTFTAFLLIMFFFIAREYILPGTIICSFFSGIFLDVVLRLLEGVFPTDPTMPIRFAASLAGTLVAAVGLAALIRTDSGLGANDLLPIIVSDKFHIQYRWAKIAADVAFISLGFLLGGVIGIGTIFSVILVGPVAQWMFPAMDRMLTCVLRITGMEKS